jgi:serine protease inhibitor
MFNALCVDGGKDDASNRVISPVSISLGMALLCVGADANTQEKLSGTAFAGRWRHKYN